MGEESETHGAEGGSLSPLDEDSMLYFFDAQRVLPRIHPDLGPEFPWTYRSASPPIIYDRHGERILGELGDDSEEEADNGLSRCFNCGSTKHLVTHCPDPYNPHLVSLSRQLFNFFRSERTIEPKTLSEAFESKHQRLLFLDTFTPGEIRGPILREALGLRGDDIGESMSWLKWMAEWGYPRGWATKSDPRDTVRRRIENQFVGDLTIEEGQGSFTIYGEDRVEELDLSRPSELTLSQALRGNDLTLENMPPNDSDFDSSDCEGETLNPSCEDNALHILRPSSTPPRRWAIYPSTYFSNDLLPIYSGHRLPSLRSRPTSSTYSDDRQSLWNSITSQLGPDSSSTQWANVQASSVGTSTPPWRLPGIFHISEDDSGAFAVRSRRWPFHELNPPPPPGPPPSPPPPPPLPSPSLSQQMPKRSLSHKPQSNLWDENDSDMDMSDSD